MGVHGLWRLIEPSARTVPLETMANKVLAVDVSIWLHQAMKGVQDAKGAPVAYAHLVVLFHRLCKLLFYKIKPVFVFDGGVPVLKKQTVANRRLQHSTARNEALKVRDKLLKNILKHEAVRQLLSDNMATSALGLNSLMLPGPHEEEELYKLPPIADHEDSNSENEESETDSSKDEEKEELCSPKKPTNIHEINVHSPEFKALAPQAKHDILSELIETRKQSSWRNINEMPKELSSFSNYQMERLMKRHSVTQTLEQTEKEMGGRTLSLQELEDMLGAQGVLKPEAQDEGRRIAQDNVTRFLFVQKTQNTPSAGDITRILDILEPEDEKPNEVEIEPSAGTCTETEDKKQFDIADHLQDVEWSSDSETDKQTHNERDVEVEGPEGASQVDKDERTLRAFLAFTQQLEENIDQQLESVETELKETKPDTDRTCLNTNSSVKEVLKIESEELSDLSDSTDALRESVEETGSLQDEKNSNKEQIKPVFIKEEENMFEEKVESVGTTSSPAAGIDDRPAVPESESESEADFVDVTQSVNDTVLVEEKLEDQEDQPIVVSIVDTKQDMKETEVFTDIFRNRKDFKALYESSQLEDDKKESSEEEEEVVVTEGVPMEKDTMATKEDDTVGTKEAVTPKAAVPDNKLTSDDLVKMQDSLKTEQEVLLAEQGRQERMAQNVTEQMSLEAQELLRLFGVPYIVAPMEAEAQCAFLDKVGLSEGTITDDSDIWLFGGQTVYKNFFNQKKHVLEYRNDDIKRYFKLTRNELIKLALLVGSDYTSGLSGVGPVTALEVLAAFPGSSLPDQIVECLLNFKSWLNGSPGTCTSAHSGLKKKLKNCVIGPGFPSVAVVEAYLNPEVDDSKEPFSWARPNVALIQDYTRNKFGWSANRTNEILMPVMKKLMETTDQSSLLKYFKTTNKESISKGVLSKRVETAIKRLGDGPGTDSDSDEPQTKKVRAPRKQPIRRTGSKTNPGPSTSSSVPEPEPRTSKFKPSLSQIKERLYKKEHIPQKDAAKRLLQARRENAVAAFKTSQQKTKPTVRRKVLTQTEMNLSESSSD